jgi:hypothetical protein
MLGKSMSDRRYNAEGNLDKMVVVRNITICGIISNNWNLLSEAMSVYEALNKNMSTDMLAREQSIEKLL